MTNDFGRRVKVESRRYIQTMSGEMNQRMKDVSNAGYIYLLRESNVRKNDGIERILWSANIFSKGQHFTCLRRSNCSLPGLNPPFTLMKWRSLILCWHNREFPSYSRSLAALALSFSINFLLLLELKSNNNYVPCATHVRIYLQIQETFLAIFRNRV